MNLLTRETLACAIRAAIIGKSTTHRGKVECKGRTANVRNAGGKDEGCKNKSTDGRTDGCGYKDYVQ